MVAPLRILPADVGAANVQGATYQGGTNQGATVQGALAPAGIEEIEGVAYEVIDDKHDNNGTAEDEVAEAPRYNLRRQQPPTFESYANPNGIEDMDLESSRLIFPSILMIPLAMKRRTYTNPFTKAPTNVTST